MSGFETPTELGLDFILDKSKKIFVVKPLGRKSHKGQGARLLA